MREEQAMSDVAERYKYIKLIRRARFDKLKKACEKLCIPYLIVEGEMHCIVDEEAYEVQQKTLGNDFWRAETTDTLTLRRLFEHLKAAGIATVHVHSYAQVK